MPKTKSYDQILKQIETLKTEAEKARRGEIEGVVNKIRTAIAHYNLTPEELGFAARAKPGPKPGGVRAKGKPGRKPNPFKKPKGVVKFANGVGGTWGGIGKRPQWLRDAINSGKQLSDFAVK